MNAQPAKKKMMHEHKTGRNTRLEVMTDLRSQFYNRVREGGGRWNASPNELKLFVGTCVLMLLVEFGKIVAMLRSRVGKAEMLAKPEAGQAYYLSPAH